MADMGINLVSPSLSGVVGPSAASGAAGATKAAENEGGSFAEALKGALEQVNGALQASDAAAVKLATGEAPNLHEVILATEQANLALQFTMAIRNKILEAYQELMRMPV